MSKLLFVNHGLGRKCGVYAQGIRHFMVLKKSTKYDFTYIEVTDYQQLVHEYEKIRPVAILYNYMPCIMPWLNYNIRLLPAKHICIIHNITQRVVDYGLYKADNFFDKYISLDMSLNVNNQDLFKTNRPVIQHDIDLSCPKRDFSVSSEPLKIGSFGFPFFHKRFDLIVKAVNEEFDEATINLHMILSDFCGNNDNEILSNCRSLITKPSIQLNYTNDYLSETEMIKYLSNNDINCLLYDNLEGVGVSAAIDYLISAQKPIIISNSQQFRNFWNYFPIYPQKTLKDIILNYDTEHENVKNIYKMCSNTCAETELILDKILI